jgi:hypothetical protein
VSVKPVRRRTAHRITTPSSSRSCSWMR